MMCSGCSLRLADRAKRAHANRSLTLVNIKRRIAGVLVAGHMRQRAGRSRGYNTSIRIKRCSMTVKYSPEVDRATSAIGM